MSAEECFANAVNDFVVAVEVELNSVSAKGNLGNALLARGVALRALRDATAERVFGSSSSPSKATFGGLSEEDVRFYGETAEDALVDKNELNTEFSNPQAITAILESSILSMINIEPYMASCIRGPAELAA